MGGIKLEYTLLVPFMLAATISFIVFIMCVILMIDIKVKALVKELSNVTKLLEAQLAVLNEKKDS